MKRWSAAILTVLLCVGPALAQYGGGMGGGLGGGNNDAPPPPPPPGSVGNPPPKMAAPKYFDGSISDITGSIITVDQKVLIPGQSPQIVSKKFEMRDSTQFDPPDFKVSLKCKVRIIYEPKDDKLVITKVIRDKDQADL